MPSPTCADCVNEKLTDHLNAIKEAVAEATDDPVAEKINELTESVLDIEIKKTVKILLSWGGPADWFELEFDRADNLLGGVYVFQDWGEGATRTLSLVEALIVNNFYFRGEFPA